MQDIGNIAQPESVSSAREQPSIMPFQFHGTGSEYFRIWLVNIILSILTLGIYSAWAKVRRKQYFYGNTKLHGASFQYLADPVKILKGRIVVVLFFAVYSVITELLPIIGSFLSIGFALFLPWLVVRSLSFNARNSALRNIRFGFDARIWDAAKAFVLWPLAGALTLGILMPYVYFNQKKFVVEHSSYGTTRFGLTATAGDYYKLFFSLLIPLIGGIVLAVLIGFVFPPISILIGIVMYLYAMAFIVVKTNNLLFNSTTLSVHGFRANMETIEYSIIVLTNTLATVLTLGLFHPWARIRAMKYKVEHLSFVPKGDIDSFVAAEQKQTSALGAEVSDIMDFDFGL